MYEAILNNLRNIDPNDPARDARIRVEANAIMSREITIPARHEEFLSLLEPASKNTEAWIRDMVLDAMDYVRNELRNVPA